MNEFDQARLGSLCDFTQGVQIADKDTLKQPQDGYVRYIYIRDLFTDKFPVYVKDVYPNKLLLSGDIVMVNTGNTSGSVYQAKEGVLCNNAFKIAVKSSKLNKLDKGFLWVYLNSDARERMLKRLFNPAGQPHVGHKNVARLYIPLPPLPEQRKIAKILGTWDKAISTTERLIDNSKQQKKALMQQLLTGKKRLLDDSGKPFEGEWEEVNLGDVVSTGRGFAFKSTQYSESGYKIVRVTNIDSSGNIDLSDCVYIPDETACEYKKYELLENDVLLVMVGATAGKLGFVTKKTLPALLNQNMWSLRTKDRVQLCQLFLKHVIYGVVAKYLLSQQGSARGFFTQKTFELVKFSIPSIQEQQKVASILTNADQEIKLLEKQLSDLKQEKKALMQQLLTGKRRVKVNDMEIV